jgi:outer membrane protein assembly factor BamB
MYRFNIHTGAEELVFSVDKPNQFSPSMWLHPGGDEILIVQNRGYTTSSHNALGVMAWNLTADTLLWSLDSFSFSRLANNVGKLLVSEDKVYLFGGQTIFCLDALTGKTHWTYQSQNSSETDFFNSENFLLIDHDLIFTQDGSIHRVNKETGKRWYLREVNALKYLDWVYLSERNDTIWFGGYDGVSGIDATNGKQLFAWDNYDHGSWINPIAVHPSRKFVYTSDWDFVFCLDPKYLK